MTKGNRDVKFQHKSKGLHKIRSNESMNGDGANDDRSPVRNGSPRQAMVGLSDVAKIMPTTPMRPNRRADHLPARTL